jgi:hypothetical protein
MVSSSFTIVWRLIRKADTIYITSRLATSYVKIKELPDSLDHSIKQWVSDKSHMQ